MQEKVVWEMSWRCRRRRLVAVERVGADGRRGEGVSSAGVRGRRWRLETWAREVFQRGPLCQSFSV